MDGYLSKSDYVRWSLCPSYYWMHRHAPAELPDKTEVVEEIIDEGFKVEALARRLFPGGRLLRMTSWDGAEAASQEASHEHTVLYQPFAMSHRLQARAFADMLVFNETTQAWDIYEVKNSTKEEEKYLIDLAYQYEVFRDAGWAMGQAYLVLLNSDYKRLGPLNPHRLFRILDRTERVQEEGPTIEVGLQAARAFDKMPKPTTCDCIEKPKTKRCPAFLYFHGIPKTTPQGKVYYEPYEIFRLSPRGRKHSTFHRDLLAKGYTTIASIPAGLIPSTQKSLLAQWVTAQKGERLVDEDALEEWLEGLVFPLYFLDYETLAMRAVPLWNNLGPYHKTVFQYSIHRVDSWEDLVQGKYHHSSYLHKTKENPGPAVIEGLRRTIGPASSIVVWNKGFEMSRHRHLAEEYPSDAPFLLGLNERVVDLMELFARHYWVDPAFQGSASIKKVLPVLAPELSYSNLTISNGSEASTLWPQAIVEGEELKSYPREELLRDLEIYCAQDTYAMIRILQEVVQVIGLPSYF